MQKFYGYIGLMFCLLGLGLKQEAMAQNGIIGAGFSSGWGVGDISYFSAGAGNSRINIRNPSGTGAGDRYFRLVRAWGGDNNQYGPAACLDVDWSLGVGASYNNMPICNTTGAFYISCPNNTDNYVFKTRAATIEDDFIYFRIQGAVQSISTVTQSPVTASVLPNNTVTVTATPSGTLSIGQGVYLRYSTNSFATSTIVAMSPIGANYVTNIPAGTNTAGTTITYYVFTSGSGLTIAPAETDYYTINLNNNSNANYSYTVATGFTTAQAGAWSVGTTWIGGSVPPADASIFINHAVTLDQDASVTNLAISASSSLESNNVIPAKNLTVKGNFTNNGTFTANNGKVIFTGGGTRQVLGSSITTFNEVEFSTEVDFVGAVTAEIGNSLIAKNGASVSNASAPKYNANSFLIFDAGTGNNIYAGQIWYNNNPSGNNGVPKNVTVRSGTLNFGGDNFYRQMDGNLLIEAGAIFTLSTSGFGDLRLLGNFTNQGTFNHLGKGTFFNGTDIQTIYSTTTPLAFGYFIIDKTSNNVLLACDINIEGSSSGDNAFEIKNTGGLDLRGFTATYTNNGANDIMVRGGARSILNTNTGEGIFRILSASNGADLQCDILETGGGSLVFGANTKLTIQGTAPGIGYGTVRLNGTILTFQNQSTLEINNRGAFVAGGSAPTYQTGSTLRYNSTNEYIRNIEWSANSGAGHPHHVEITNNTYFCLGGNAGTGVARTIRGNLTIASGSTLAMVNQQISPTHMTAAFSVLGNVNNTGTLQLSNVGNGDLNVEGNFTNGGTFTAFQRTVTLNGTGSHTLTANASTIFYNLTVHKSGTSLVQLAGTQAGITVSNLLKIDGTNTADIDLNYKNIDLGSTGTMLENRAGNVIITDNTAGLTDYNQGGAIILTNRTIPTTLAGTATLAGTGLDLASSSTTVGNLTIYRYHYRGGSLTSNAGIRKVYRLSADAFGANTVTLRIYYATQEVPVGMTVNQTYRWSSAVAPLGWKPYETGEAVGADNVHVNGLTSFSHWTLGQENIPLNATIQTLIGKKIADYKSKIEWTVSNQPTTGFEVEKSFDGINFQNIGFVASEGRNFTDESFWYSAYYRLKQVDAQGTTSYSPFVFIENGAFRVYPNPIVREVTLQIPFEPSVEVQIALFDATGRQVGSAKTTVERASQTLASQLTPLSAGTYILQVRGQARQWTEKVIKL